MTVIDCEWVDLEDRLPDNVSNVFTIDVTSEICNACFYYADRFECTQSGDNVTENVTHWMYVPDAEDILKEANDQT